jgi:outer membrane lipoprotein carrier protein
MRRFFYLIIGICLILPGFSWAQSTADELQAKLSNFNNVTANFNQVVKNSAGVILQKSSGVMALQRPGKFRWDTKKPLRQLIITDGGKVWIYEPDLQQVTIRKLDKSVGQTPVLLLTSPDIYLQQNFIISKLPKKQATESFQLMPKNKNETFDKIILTFKNNIIFQMILSNQLGQYTILNFSNVSRSSKLKSKLFKFTIPKGIDVIDNTKVIK